MKSAIFRFFLYLFLASAFAVLVILAATSAIDLHAAKALEIAFVLALAILVISYIGFAVTGLYLVFQRNEKYRHIAIVLGFAALAIELILYRFEMEPMFLGLMFPFIFPVGLCLAIVCIVIGIRNKKGLDSLAALAFVLNMLPLTVVLLFA